MAETVWAWGLFLGCLLFRCLNGWAVRTYFNPDEFWQSLEIAHRLVFGYGYVTWEWHKGIRGYTHPLIFAALYWLLAQLGWDTTTALWLGPRLLQAVFAAIGDVYLFRLTKKLFSQRAAYWALFCQLSNWFTFFTITRTFSNCVEAPLTTMALFYWPLSGGAVGVRSGSLLTRRERRERQLALLLAGAACAVRPTSAIVWIYVGTWHLFRTHDKLRFLALEVVPIGALCLALSTAVDRVMYGRWLLVPLEFVRFNLLSSGADVYGTHPWHWYFTQGFPAMATTLLLFVVIGVAKSKRWRTAGIIGWTLALYSFLPHKEFRFVLPVLPLALAFAGNALEILERSVPTPLPLQTSPSAQPRFPRQSATSSLRRRGRGAGDGAATESQGQSGRTSGQDAVDSTEMKCRNREKRDGWGARTWGLAAFVFVTQVPMALYFSLFHQGGSIAVMSYLARETKSGNATGILFLMPCHSTPYYSHIHAPIPMRMLDCSPSNQQQPRHESESDAFLRDPASFVATARPLSHPFMACDCALQGIPCQPQQRGPRDPSIDREMSHSPHTPTPPSHIVLFDSEEHKLAPFLAAEGYKQIRNFFHAHVPVDRDLQGQVVVYARQNG